MKLEELKKLCEAATPVEYVHREAMRRAFRYLRKHIDIDMLALEPGEIPEGQWIADKAEDADLLYHARTELPRLIGLLERAKLLLPQAASYIEAYYYEQSIGDDYDPYREDIHRVAEDIRQLIKEIEG